MMHKGSCHCGAVAFEAEIDLAQVIECNCSICRKKGYRLAFAPREALRVIRGEDSLATYTFNTHTIQHRFCTNCGCAPFGEGRKPTGEAMAAINVRCLDDVDPTDVTAIPYNGRDA